MSNTPNREKFEVQESLQELYQYFLHKRRGEKEKITQVFTYLFSL